MINLTVASPWFQHWQLRPQAKLRLFCFSHAGGGASLFRTWSEDLPAMIEICPIQLPGRESRLLEAPFTHLFALLGPLSEALLPYLDKPYAFFGHSMGALISFELTRYLRRKELSPGPVHLFVSCHRAPHLPDPDLPTYHLPDPAFIQELRRLKGTEEEILQDEQVLQLILPHLRADFEICETYFYVHEAPLSCPITAYGALEDSKVPYTLLPAWQEQTDSHFNLHLFDGDHFFLYQTQASLLRVLAQDIFNNYASEK